MPELNLYCQVKAGMIKVTQKSPYEHRFWSRVDKQGPIHPVLGTRCWRWLGEIMKQNGYGKLRKLAHRYSWELHNGPIPDGLSVLHHCDNPFCSNPAHLFLGTQQDNLAGMRAKGRQVKGEKQWQAVLTEQDVVAIRKRYKRYSHKDGCGAIAKQYKVTLIAIYKAVMGINWKHVQNEE